MGVGGNFWDLLKPYGKAQGFEFLRNKRVAVDLSYWIVQQETALKGQIHNPHIRLTFFRTINLFSKFGAFPVFVRDGTASPLKSQARIARFFRTSGIDLSSFSAAEDGILIERNKAFRKCEQECVDLLELLGVPVLKAIGEAEALCAQLNRDGEVDACITADSDAFLFGANCVIKNIQPNSKEPFECYHMSDIESGLGLRRNHLIAISLLVGNDHNLTGVPGIGLETALRFVKSFSEDVILNRLQEIGGGNVQVFQRDVSLDCNFLSSSDESPRKNKVPHCSFCGHPGSKKAHVKFACQHCFSTANEGCIQKPLGFRCNCSSCDLDNKEKEKKKNENWQIKVCRMIASQQNFPNNEITEMYLNKHQQSDSDFHLSWTSPNVDMLVDHLAYYQHWEPSYTRQRMLPMLSTIFLRDVAANSKDGLLCGQYEFDSIQRVKKRFGCQFYVINWKKTTREMRNAICFPSEDPDTEQELGTANESTNMLDEPDALQIYIKDGCSFLSTEEDMELVRSAFPEKVSQFLREKELKETKASRKRSVKPDDSETPRGVQLSITNFYRSSKVLCHETPEESEAGSSKISVDTSGEKSKEPVRNYSKSARRKLLFVLHVGETMDTLNAIWERKNILDLILTNIHRLNTNGVDILQIIKNRLNLPTILMSPDDTRYENQVQDCSVAAYVVNFSDTNEMNKLWQMALEKEKCRKTAVNQEENDNENALRMPQNVTETSTENTSSADDDAATKAHLKGKQKAYSDKKEENEENRVIGKKRRVVWTPKMHQSFLQAIQQLGHEKAVPKKIVEFMNEPGLTREHVASHLQKYRMCLKRAQERSAAASFYNQILTNDVKERCCQVQPHLNASSFNAPRGYSHSIQQPFQTLFQQGTGGKNMRQPQMLSFHNETSYQQQNNFLDFASSRQTNNSGLIGQQFTSFPRIAHSSSFRVYGDKRKNMLFSIQSGNADQPTNSNAGLDFIGFRLSKDGTSVNFGHNGSSCAVISNNTYSGLCSSMPEDYIHQQQSSSPLLETPIENTLIQCPSAPPENFTFHHLQATLPSREQHPPYSISEQQSLLIFENVVNKISCHSLEMPARISGDLEGYSAILFGDEVSVSPLQNNGNYDCRRQEYSAPELPQISTVEADSFGTELDIKSLLETTENRSSQSFWEGDSENELY